MAAETTEQSEPQQTSIDSSDAISSTAQAEPDLPVAEAGAESPAVSTAVEAAAAAPRTGVLTGKALIAAFEATQLRDDLPEIFVGDTVKVGVRIREGNKERVQPYEGVVIAKRHGGLNATITVRRIFQGIGVERVFMLHSPQVASVKVERRGKVRRAKLFYLRDRVGKATRVKQRFDR
ncbi:MAG: 50S ribosomal protein L19 [Synechococcaceae cyanobacterium]|nr:50S ribosomal protein L19 [Synechococcaceae cyanobacterium]